MTRQHSNRNPPMAGSVPTVVFVAALVSVGYLISRSLTCLKNSLPPGPRRWPLIGSVLEIPQKHQWVTFSKWSKTYGDIVYLDALGQPIIVINSAKVANDLLDRRSSIYSDRPNLAMAKSVSNASTASTSTMCGYGNTFALQPYNDNWRQQRKLVAQEFGSSAVRHYHPFQEAEARKLVHGLVDDPTTLPRQTQLRIGTIINDPFLTNFSQATASGVWAVDLLPMLKYLPTWMPGTVFLQTAKRWRKKNRDGGNLEPASGTVLLPNLCANTIEASDGKLSEEQEDRLVWAASTVLGGGLDTASIPHALRQDDIYDGMHLPKGSLVIPNIWHMLHDPTVFPNPMEFNPDRYQGLDSEMDKITNVMFGFGRRACPGKNFAEATFFAIVSTVLATCEILPVRDSEGHTVVPHVSYSSGTISFPSSFKCDVKCRSPEAYDLLAQGYSADEAT
ncbi:putative monooxygenase [Mycena olivaceomarginata]|nr:putative monooxygenase [Mycena olivaceomarginata]